VSAAAVRKVIAAYMAPPSVPGLATVFRGLPVTIQPQDWPVGPDTGWGAGAYVHINDIREKRISVGGPTGGIKKVVYDCALVIFFRWQFSDHGPYNTTDGWTEAFDGLIDAITERIRGDRTMGCGSEGPVWQVGEGDGEGDGDDIRTQVDAPHEDSGQVIVWAALEFTVVEMVNQG